MFDIFDLFDNMDFFPASIGYREEVKCPVCGKTYTDFRRTGKLGCPECYRVFKEPLSAVLRQIHSDYKHTGKIPGNMRAKLSLQRQIELLKNSLKDAVKNEDYETAAKLHKEIQELERGSRK